MTGTTQIPHALNNYYDKVMITRATPFLAHDMFGQMRNVPLNSTETIKFRKYNALTPATTPLTEGVTPVGSDASVTDVTATLSEYGDYIKYTDKVSLTSPDPALTEFAQVLGEQEGQTLDIVTREVLVAGTNVQYANDATSRETVASDDDMDEAEIREAVLTLKNANAPKITQMVKPSQGYNTTPVPECYIGIIHPNLVDPLRYDSGSTWQGVEKYAASAGQVFPGEVGRLGDVRFIETTHAKVFTGAGASSIDVYATLILGANAYGVTRLNGAATSNIIKPLGSAGADDPLNQRGTTGWKAFKTAAILQPLFIVRIESAA